MFANESIFLNLIELIETDSGVPYDSLFICLILIPSPTSNNLPILTGSLPLEFNAPNISCADFC